MLHNTPEYRILAMLDYGEFATIRKRVLSCMYMNVITIPRTLAKNDDLVILPRKQYEHVMSMVRGGQTVSKRLESELTKLSHEAHELKSKGKLLLVKSLRDLRS